MSVRRRENLATFCALLALIVFVEGTFGLFGIGTDNETTATGGGGGTSTSATTLGGGGGKAAHAHDTDDSVHRHVRKKRQQPQTADQQQLQLNIQSLPMCAPNQSPIAPIPSAGPPLSVLPPTVVCLKCRPSSGPLSGNDAHGNGT